MSVLLAKLYWDDLSIELHSLRMMKFSLLDRIEICLKLSDRLSDALYVMKTNLRVRVREMMMENSATMQCLKTLFREIHSRILELNERRRYVKRWIDHHEHFCSS